MKIKVGPKVADHHSILVILPDKMETRDLVFRKAWHYKDANWQMINRRIEDYDLASLRNFSVDIVVDSFVSF